MILIADSGSTKTSWLAVEGDNNVTKIITAGYNPYYYKYEFLVNIIQNELLPKLKNHNVEKIYYYGSGCSSDINCTKVKTALWDKFPGSLVEINHDLTGAAVALLKNNEGIACILGTGSNSCYWNGQEVVSNVPSVGYLLGDEGSGTYIGMKILKGILENKAPSNITSGFYHSFDLNFEKVLSRIYENTEPNRFFAGISKFAGDNINNPWIRAQVKQCFVDFIENQIKQYPNYSDIDISFTGSIAYYFKDLLIETMTENKLNLGIILQEPIDGLLDFHSR